MRRFKDSANIDMASKVAKSFKFDAEKPENFEKSFVRANDDIYSLVKKPSGRFELGFYRGGVKLNYTPIKEFNELSGDDIKSALQSFMGKQVKDSVQGSVSFDTGPVIDLLVRALADEVIAWWQYFSLRPFVTGNEGPHVEETFAKYGDDEMMDHARKIIDRLNQLGANPSVFYDIPRLLSSANDPQRPFVGTDSMYVVANNVVAERNAINVYQELAKYTRDVEDFTTHDMVKEILADEQEHITELCDLYNQISGGSATADEIVNTGVGISGDESVNTESSVGDMIVSDGRVWKPEFLKIQDVAEEEQTEELKVELYNLVKQFVYKYQRIYYPRYKGELDDLIVDFYEQFLTKKGRGEKKESLLDKYNPKTTSLPYLVKVAVTRMLIDRSRTDKNELNYAEKYDEQTGDLSLDFLAGKMEEENVSVDDIVFSEDDIFYLRDKYDELSEKEKKHFLRMYKEVKNVLSPNFKELFKDLVGY